MSNDRNEKFLSQLADIVSKSDLYNPNFNDLSLSIGSLKLVYNVSFDELYVCLYDAIIDVLKTRYFENSDNSYSLPKDEVRWRSKAAKRNERMTILQIWNPLLDLYYFTD